MHADARSGEAELACRNQLDARHFPPFRRDKDGIPRFDFQTQPPLILGQAPSTTMSQVDETRALQGFAHVRAGAPKVPQPRYSRGLDVFL